MSEPDVHPEIYHPCVRHRHWRKVINLSINLISRVSPRGPPNSQIISHNPSCFHFRPNIPFGNVSSFNYLWVKLGAVSPAAALIQSPVWRTVTLAPQQTNLPRQPCGLVDDEWLNNVCETPEPQEVKRLLAQEFVDSRKRCVQCGVNKGNQWTATKHRPCDDLLTKSTDLMSSK